MTNLRILAAALLLAANAVHAAEGDLPYRTSGWYFGAGVGYGSLELDASPLKVSGGDLGYKILGGYRFPRAFLPLGLNLALEGAWTDLGEVTDNAGPNNGLALSMDGFTGYLVGNFPLTRKIEFFGKVGAYLWEANFDVNGATRDKDDGTALALGVGFAYQTGGQLGFRLELEGYDALDRALLTSASITYQFK